MAMTRREFGRLALAGVPAAILSPGEGFVAALAQGKPNSLIDGVQIGTITYSYRSMPDQSAEATLKYIVDSGISAIELMGGPVNDWARKKGNFKPSVVPEGRGGGRGAGGGRGEGRGERPTFAPVANMKTGWGNDQPAGQWNGTPCPAPPEGRGGGAGGRGAGGGGGQGRGRGQQTPEQIAAAEEERKWRLGLSMDIFKELRKMYNDAGVTIYAVKDVREQTDEDLEYTFMVAKTLGASHITLELPAGENAATRLKRLGDTAMTHKMFVAYHTHQQGSMTAFDEAFALSKGNMANVDLGHLVAATAPGGSPLDFLTRHHARVSSFHLKDRTTIAHCALNLPFGHGETPIKEILQLVKKNKWRIPASIELEYDIPEGSDAVQEMRKCVEYCRRAITSRT